MTIPVSRINFSKKTVALVTGASRGIGREIAIHLSAHLSSGSVIALIARSNDDLLQTKSLMNQNKGLKTLHYALDLSKPVLEDYEKLFEDIKPLATDDVENAIIFHNAGSLGVMNNLSMLTDHKVWDTYCNLNISSMGMLNAVFVKTYRGKKMYNINITSRLGVMPVKSAGMYGLGKSARNYYFKVLALEEPDIIVLNYSPGPVDTVMFETCCAEIKDEKVKASFDKLKVNHTVLTPNQTVSKLMRILIKGDFMSGDVIDYYEYE